MPDNATEVSPRVLLVCESRETERLVRERLAGELNLTVCGADSPELDQHASRAALIAVEVIDRERDCEVIGALKSAVRAPVVALLEHVNDGRLASALAAGADDFVLLPTGQAELLARLRGRMNARRSNGNEQEPTSEALLDLTRTLVSSLDFQEILYILVSRVAEVIDVDRVSLVLAPGDGEVGFVVAASDDQKLTNLRLDLAKYPEIRHVLKTKVSLTIHDVDHHPLLDEVRRSVAEAGLSALTLIPIVWDDHSMGVLFVRARTRRGALSPHQRRFCEVLANATAIALRNARAVQTLRDETQRDVYARMEAEKRLSTLKRYADLLASAADGLAAFDPDGQLLFANPAAHTILGFEHNEYLGKKLWELVPNSDRMTLMKLRQRLRRGEHPHNFDLTLRSRHGHDVRINGSFAPLAGSEGAVLLSFRDVTEDRRVRDELVNTRNFLQSLIDASVDAIVAARMDGTIVLFNKGAQRLYGFAAEEAIGKMSATMLYPGDGAREVMRMLSSTGHGGVGRLEPVRIEAIDRHGTIFPISLTAAIIYEGGKATATFGIFTDLRERVRVEQALAQAQEKLAVSEKQALVAELAGAAAHELNQPLTSVMGYAELLLRKLPTESPTRRGAEVIHREAERMAEIVRKIGRLTRYETKSYVGEQRILDIDAGSTPKISSDEPGQSEAQ